MAKAVRALVILLGLLVFLTPATRAEDLMDIYLLAKENDQLYWAQEASYQAALQALPKTRAALLPQVSAEAGMGWRVYDDKQAAPPTKKYPARGKEYYNSQNYSLRLRQTLFNASQWARLSKAEAEVLGAEVEMEKSRQELMARVAQRYLALLEAQENLALSQASRLRLAKSLEQARRAVELGAMAPIEVDKARAKLDLSLAEVVAARSGVTTRREELSQLTGRRDHSLASLSPAFSLDPPQPADPEAWSQRALVSNPEVLNRIQKAEAARQEMRSQWGGYLPTLELDASHGYTDSLGGRTPSEADNSALLLNLSFPILRGGLVMASVRQARFQLKEARRRLEDAKRAAVVETRRSYFAVLSTAELVQALTRAEVSSQKALHGAESAFKAGAIDVVSLMESMNDWRQSRKELISARHAYILEWLNLHRSAGMLSEGHLRQINRHFTGSPAQTQAAAAAR